MVDDVVAGSAAELATLYPVPKVITFAGRKVDIPAASIRHGPQVLQRWLTLSIGDGEDEIVYADEHPAEFVDLIVLALNCDRDWVEALGPIEKVDLFYEWLEVNACFFLVRLPQTRARQQQTAAGLFGVGPISSTDSSEAAISMPKTTRPPRLNSSAPPPIETNTAAASSTL